MTAPIFFVDRSLGRVRLPRLMRAAGWTLVTLSEHYGIPEDEQVTDVEWLQLAGQRGWSVLMKDTRIRYRPAERAALVEAGVRAFCLTSGNLGSSDMAEAFARHRRRIWELSAIDGPLLYSVTRSELREIEL